MTTPLSPQARAEAYAALERRYDGPIPQAALDRLEYGSATNAEIARTSDSIAFFHGEIRCMRRSAKRWTERGNREMARQNIEDSWLYLREWRALRRHLKDLRGTDSAVKGAKQFFDTIYPKEPES